MSVLQVIGLAPSLVITYAWISSIKQAMYLLIIHCTLGRMTPCNSSCVVKTSIVYYSIEYIYFKLIITSNVFC